MELDAQLETSKLAFYSKLTLKSNSPHHKSVTGRPGWEPEVLCRTCHAQGKWARQQF